jgi:hypothetical protein
VTCLIALTLVLLDCHHFRDCGLQNTDVSKRMGWLELGPQLHLTASVHDPGTSTYPFKSPPSARANNATGRLGANPKISILSAVPASPVIKTGFRPILSLSLPHTTPDENSANANADVTIPA